MRSRRSDRTPTRPSRAEDGRPDAPDRESEGKALLERSRWFIGRRAFPGLSDLPSDALTRARRQRIELLARARLEREAPASAFPVASSGSAAKCVTPDGQRIGLRRVKNPQPRGSFGFASRLVEAKAVPGPAFLRIPVDTGVIRRHEIDVASLRLFRWDPAQRRFRLVRASGPDSHRRAVHARITRPGIYGVVGLSANPWIRETVRVANRLRPWLHALRAIGPAIAHRICRLILCPQSRLRPLTRSAQELRAIGLPAYPGGFLGGACDRCLARESVTLLDGPEVDLVGEQEQERLSWESLGPRNFNGRVSALAIHPTNADIVYAGASNGGVWKTSDSGKTWMALMDDVDCPSIGALAVHLTDPNDPTAPVTIYAGTGEPVDKERVTYPGIGVLKSTDGGLQWALTGILAPPGGRPPRGIAAIVVDPTAPQTVYVAAFLGGLYKSTDGGAAWTLQRVGDYRSLTMDPSDPLTLYAGQSDSGVCKTVTGGEPVGGAPGWTLVANGLPAPHATGTIVNVAVAAGAGKNVVYAKFGTTVYSSVNGARFVDRGDRGGDTYVSWCSLLAVHPTTPDTVFAGGVSLERSDNTGTAWKPVNGTGSDTETTALHADQHALVADPATPDVVYVANDGGVYRSDDRGDTWHKRSDGLVITEFYDAGVGSGSAPLLGGGAQDGGVLESVAGDLYWSRLLGGDGGQYVVDPADPTLRYYDRDGLIIWKRVGSGVQSAADNGIDRRDRLPWIGVIAMDPTASIPVANRVLYTGTTFVYKTANGAGLWARATNDLGAIVSAIAVAPGNPSVVYAGTQAGDIHVSTSAGNPPASWIKISRAPLPGRSVTRLAVDRSDAKIVYATFSGFDAATPAFPGHIFRGSDHTGAWSWQRIDGVGVGVPALVPLPDIPANALEIDRDDADVLYVGTDVGVFRTTDAGVAWHGFDEGLPSCIVSDLTLDLGANVLYAATFGRGMYRRQL